MLSSNLPSKYIKATHKILSLLTKCKTPKHLKQLQQHLTVTGTLKDPYASGKLITSYTSQGQLSHAHTLFLHLPHKSTFIFNTLIQSYVEHNNATKALPLYKNMMQNGFLPNNYTLSFLLKACVMLENRVMGVCFHCQVVKLGWEGYDFVLNGLVHMYVSCGGVEAARKLFDLSGSRDVVTWTALVNGYVREGQVRVARELFDRMPERSEVSWTVMITGYVEVGLFKEALGVFCEMVGAGVRGNRPGINGAVNSCASLGALDRGRVIHCYVYKIGLGLDDLLGTSIVDMYAKCGCIDAACSLFDEMLVRDVFTYTSLISGLANHDRSASAVELFYKMKDEGVVPNEVTFICVLSACSRMGLVQEGLKIFKSMSKTYGVEPGVQHYGCLVDLFGRAGMLKEAKNIIKDMPKTDSYALGALLDACRVHGDVELGKEILNSLVQQRLDQDGKYVLLSNIYASANQWGDVEKVRNNMEAKKVKKVPGCSSIEINGLICEFVAGDRSYVAAEETASILFKIDKHLKSTWFNNDDNIACEEMCL